MYKKIIQKFQFSTKQICLCALGFRTITQTGSSKVAILFLLIIVQSENSIAFSLFCLSNQVTVFSVVLDTSYFRVRPRPVRLQAAQELTFTFNKIYMRNVKIVYFHRVDCVFNLSVAAESFRRR